MDGARKHGFSLVELVIVIVILAVIAAVALPRISRGAKDAEDSSLSQNLALLRSAIEMYSTDHRGAYPGTDSASFGAALTLYSDALGNTSGTRDPSTGKIYGPYLLKIPPLSVGANKGRNTVAVGDTGPIVGGTAGWVYNYKTGQIIANCADSELSDAGSKYNTW